LEFNKKEAMQRLASFYVNTFREKGHIRRLTALLDDEEYEIQQIGIDALTEVLEILLTHYNEKHVIDALNNSQRDESTQIT
jgi:hypothetical protein